MLGDNEVKIIKGCISGDRKSQKVLYQTYYGRMLSVCMRYSTDVNEAKDILHDGFIKVFERINHFEFKGSLEGWIKRVMVHTAIDNIRRKRDIYYENEAEMESVIKNPDDLESEKYVKIKSEIIIKLIQKLSPVYRTIFNMYIIENFTHKEIAEELNISEGTSKSNLAKAKMKMKELFEEYIKENKKQLL